MRAAIYARVSTAEQAEEGHSIEAQVRAMHSFCKDRGWDVAGVYLEPGVSGTTDQRPALQAVLKSCEAGEVDILVTHQLDRLARNLALQIELLGKLGRWGVAYVSTTEQIDYSTPQGMLFMQMLGAFNEYYVANLAREVAKGKLGRARKGLSNASIPAYGYKRVDGVDVVVPEQADVVQFIYDQYLTGSRSFQSLASDLNLRGIRSGQWSKTGKWLWKSVEEVLSNPFYYGVVRYRDDLYPGQHEAIIDKNIFDRVQGIRRGGRSHIYPGSSGRSYLLQGLLRCDECGQRYYVAEHPPYRYYYHRNTGACVRGTEKRIRMEVFDTVIEALVMQLDLPEGWKSHLAELVEHDDHREEIQRKRKALKTKLSRLKWLYAEGDLKQDEYKRKRDGCQAELARLREPEPLAVAQAAQVLLGLGAAWENADTKTRHEIVATIFEAVLSDGKEIICVRPHSEFAPLFRLDGMEEKDGCFYIG